VLVPEIRRQLLHAAREQIGILDRLVARIILGFDADDRRLDPQVDVLGHQRDSRRGKNSLQCERIGQDRVVGAMAGQTSRQHGFEQLRLKEQRPPGGACRD
jgi:hypothetical protein